jgi:hypothetical protein
MEAMACGTPVAGFEVGALPDMITDSVSGYLAPTGDARALGEAIIRCATTPAAQPAIKAAARQTIETHYNLKIQAERYLEHYRKALALAKPAGSTNSTASQVCPISGDAGGLLDDYDILRPLGQVIKKVAGDSPRFDPGWSFGTRKEKRRVRHYLKNWLNSLPTGRHNYLTDDHGIYSHDSISLRSGFRNPEGPYPEMHLPWPLVWSEMPEAQLTIINPITRPARLITELQSPFPGLVITATTDSGQRSEATLPENLGNPDLVRTSFQLELPKTKHSVTVSFRFQLPEGTYSPINLAAAFFRIEINRD